MAKEFYGFCCDCGHLKREQIDEFCVFSCAYSYTWLFGSCRHWCKKKEDKEDKKDKK